QQRAGVVEVVVVRRLHLALAAGADRRHLHAGRWAAAGERRDRRPRHEDRDVHAARAERHAHQPGLGRPQHVGGAAGHPRAAVRVGPALATRAMPVRTRLSVPRASSVVTATKPEPSMLMGMLVMAKRPHESGAPVLTIGAWIGSVANASGS